MSAVYKEPPLLAGKDVVFNYRALVGRFRASSIRLTRGTTCNCWNSRVEGIPSAQGSADSKVLVSSRDGRVDARLVLKSR
jgi:hypothetical protein